MVLTQRIGGRAAMHTPLPSWGQERPIHGGLDESAYPPITTKSLNCGNRRLGPRPEKRKER